MAVPSPCVGVCRLDPRTGCCEGCHRTGEEIAAWPRLSDEQKRALLRALDRRQAQEAGWFD